MTKNENNAEQISEVLSYYVATGKITTEQAFIQKCKEYTPQIMTEVIVDKLFDQDDDRSWLMLSGCFWYPTHGIKLPVPYTTIPHISLSQLWQIVQYIYPEEAR